MFQAPVRLLVALRPSVSTGVLVSTAVSTVVFSATPFLVRGVALDFGVDLGTVGIISTAQLGGFSLATWLAGRLLRPRRRTLAVAIVLGVVANLLSGLVGVFGLLVLLRLLSGISLGLIAWIAWAEAFGDSQRTGDIAVIGPIVGTIASPVVAVLIDRAGVDALFFVLAGLFLVPLALVHSTRLNALPPPEHGQRHRPTRAAAAILVCLGLMTTGGSAVFVYAGVIGQDNVGMSALAVSLVFAGNAIAGVPSARYRGTRKLPGLWIMVTAACALLIGVFNEPAVFWIALTLWGFSFWMAVPGAFALLAERSRYPNERAGDAQSVMAAGRVVGPLVGGAAYALSPATLGIVGFVVIGAAALLMVYIEWRIHPSTFTDLVPA